MPPAALAYEDVSFAFPGMDDGSGAELFSHLALSVPQGAFALLVGATGSGKTTLLRLAKPEIAPVGARRGSVRVQGHAVEGLSVEESAQLVGYVFQDPDNQIVCDTVAHELAFGLENLGMTQAEMRRRLAEACRFLGIEPWLHRRCAELSCGQRQVVALAAVLVMRPRLLLLDEPTALLDPVAAQSFLSLLFRTNRELGTTVVMATHSPRQMRAYATHAYMLAEGAVRPCTLDELDAREAAEDPAPTRGMPSHAAAQASAGEQLLGLSGVWARYGRSAPWVLRGCDLELRRGEVRALLGGNGSGKSTLLAVAARTLRPRHGRVHVARAVRTALLPQSPKALLGCETVREELLEWQRLCGYELAEADEALGRLGLQGHSELHPYDLSGGQQQLLALEKVLLTHPDLVLLDEPSKGLDSHERARLAARISTLASRGAAVLVSTHDHALVRSCADRVSLLFDGQVGVPEDADAFLAASWMWHA
jgi:energy-coupling factor transport system ATP-binding protein